MRHLTAWVFNMSCYIYQHENFLWAVGQIKNEIKDPCQTAQETCITGLEGPTWSSQRSLTAPCGKPALVIHVKALWVVTVCSVAVGYKHFGGQCCLYLQGEGPLISWYPTATLHNVTTQKTMILIITAMKASNLSSYQFDHLLIL